MNMNICCRSERNPGFQGLLSVGTNQLLSPISFHFFSWPLWPVCSNPEHYDCQRYYNRSKVILQPFSFEPRKYSMPGHMMWREWPRILCRPGHQPSRKGAANIRFCKTIIKNCIKSRMLWSTGTRPPPPPLLRPPHLLADPPMPYAIYCGFILKIKFSANGSEKWRLCWTVSRKSWTLLWFFRAISHKQPEICQVS